MPEYLSAEGQLTMQNLIDNNEINKQNNYNSNQILSIYVNRQENTVDFKHPQNSLFPLEQDNLKKIIKVTTHAERRCPTIQGILINIDLWTYFYLDQLIRNATYFNKLAKSFPKGPREKIIKQNTGHPKLYTSSDKLPSLYKLCLYSLHCNIGETKKISLTDRIIDYRSTTSIVRNLPIPTTEQNALINLHNTCRSRNRLQGYSIIEGPIKEYFIKKDSPVDKRLNLDNSIYSKTQIFPSHFSYDIFQQFRDQNPNLFKDTSGTQQFLPLWKFFNKSLGSCWQPQCPMIRHYRKHR
jgi:hypothetical protein